MNPRQADPTLWSLWYLCLHFLSWDDSHILTPPTHTPLVLSFGSLSRTAVWRGALRKGDRGNLELWMRTFDK